MNNWRAFILFVSAILLVYGGVNWLIYRRVCGAAGLPGGWGVALKVVLWALILAYPMGRLLQGRTFIASPLIWVGSFWLAAMTYAFLFVILIGLLEWLDTATGWLPYWVVGRPRLTARVLLLGGVVLIGGVLIGGRMSALRTKLSTVEIRLPHWKGKSESARLVAFADTHFGALVGEKRAAALVRLVASLEPDALLIVGDMIDEPVGRVEWLGKYLPSLKTRWGVWAVTGNHEYYSGVEEATRKFEEWGIRVLRNEAAVVGEKFNLVGIDDRTGSRQFGELMVPISRLMERVDPSLPTILLHHTPLRYEEASSCGVDLMLSAHTHGGQLWPLGYITRWVYGVKEGMSRIGDMSFYLTTGTYTWGPPIRVGAPSEVVVIELKGGD